MPSVLVKAFLQSFLCKSAIHLPKVHETKIITVVSAKVKTLEDAVEWLHTVHTYT